MTWPRMIRPKYGELKKPMIAISRRTWVHSPPPEGVVSMTAAIAIAKISCGKASRMSMIRLIAVSTAPPK